jgi:hypothetical protein
VWKQKAGPAASPPPLRDIQACWTTRGQDVRLVSVLEERRCHANEPRGEREAEAHMAGSKTTGGGAA